MFEKNLQDLVKGIRSAKGDGTVFIAQALQEIKTELRGTDPFIKAQAVRKLTYLHMLGYDMCWAAFHVVEVMSYERFAHKRIGYNAACQSFTQSTDVVLLCTNLLKKEFGSTNEHEVGLAINVLANIVTTDLARDLLGDVLTMMGSSKPYVRKKATLVLYKIFLRYPQGLRLSFDKLKERMEEPDITVVSCAVNVICELANKKPKNYLGLAPEFFRLLTTSSNNWMLIKVVKLLASLVPEEPRLARKLLDPLATVIQNTPAKSLLYECISTVTTALLYTKKSDGSQPRNVAAVVRLCNDHLRRYIEDPDQNLRYLGLVGLGNLMKSHPYVVKEQQELIVECLAVDDITIRMRALELLSGMVNPDNAVPIIRELMRQTLNADGAYRHELITHILHVCSVSKYANIHDFDWYIHVLVQLARVPGNNAAMVDAALSSLSPSSGSMLGSSTNMKLTDDEPRKRSHGVEVARQLVDIAVRVKSVRSIMVDSMIQLLIEKEALGGPGAGTLKEVYYAAAWIMGEYVMTFLDDVDHDDEEEDEDEDDDEDEEKETEEEKLQRLEDLAGEMLQPRSNTLPAYVQTVFIQALLKILTAMAERADDAMMERTATVVMKCLPTFVQSEYVEVQERAVCLQQLLLALNMGLGALSARERTERAFDGSASVSPAKKLDVLNSYFAERLAPVGAKAQRKVPLPGDLDLNEPLNNAEAKFLESGGDVSAFSNEDDLEVSFVSQVHAGIGGGYSGISDGSSEQKPEHKHRRRHHSSSSSESESENSVDERKKKKREHAREQERLRKDPFYLSGGSQAFTDAGANASFADMMDAFGPGTNGKKKKALKKSKSRDIFEIEVMPDGARSSDEDRRRYRKKRVLIDEDETDLAAVDLSTPLGEDEKVPTEQWVHRQTPSAEPVDDKKKSKKRSSKHRRSLRGEDDGKKKRASSSKSSKFKNSSRKQLIEDVSDEEVAKANESRSHRRSSSTRTSSSHNKSSSSKTSGDDEKSKKKKRKDKHKSSKRQEAPPPEPLLLF